jgi:hypothetical protein
VSEHPFSIRIKIKDYEVELSGSFAEVKQILDDLPSITNRISDTLEIPSNQNEVKQASLFKSDEEKPPAISAPSGISCPEAITRILSTKWGRKQPRYFREILNTLKINALHYPTGTVKGRLTDLTKKGVLRRIRSEKGYGYVLAK